MPELTLVIGDKTHSSWSLRPWLAMRVAGIPFQEILVPLYQPDTAANIRRYSPTGKVPVLLADERPIWESLAILEYLAEHYPEAGLWPADPAARALARTASAEMHAGFTALRAALPQNFRRDVPHGTLDDAVRQDIARVEAVWHDCRARYGVDGPFLFGGFSNADAMFAPVVGRFLSYQVEVGEEAQDYMRAVLALPAMQEWIATARTETWRSPYDGT